MTSQTKRFNITVIDTTGGGGDTALETAFAGLSAGTWGTFTLGNTFNPDPPASGDTIMSYTQRANYDPTRKVVQFVGGAHGTGGGLRTWLVTLDLATNQWLAPVAVSNSNTIYDHQYCNNSIDLATGRVYIRHGFADTGRLQIFDQATRSFLSPLTGPTFGTNYGVCIEYHPGMSRLLWGHYWGVAQSNNGGAFSDITTANRIGDQAPVCTYNPKDNCVYMGGGNGSGAGQLWKINASGVMTQVAYPPVTIAVWDGGSGSSTSALFGAGNPANKMFTVSKGGAIYEYDDVLNTWSGQIGSLPAGARPGVNSDADFIIAPIRNTDPNKSGVLVFKLSSMTATSTTAHIWKR